MPLDLQLCQKAPLRRCLSRCCNEYDTHPAEPLNMNDELYHQTQMGYTFKGWGFGGRESPPGMARGVQGARPPPLPSNG